MKKYFFTLTALFINGMFANAQSASVVINEKLTLQVTKNQVVRIASNESFLNSYEKQRKLYDKINERITQIIAIQEFIYDKLRNVNSAIKQGKQMYYLAQKFAEIGGRASEVLNLTAQYPQYAVLLYDLYVEAGTTIFSLQEELYKEILSESNDFLMDPMDRQGLIQIISEKANMLNGTLFIITLKLKDAKKTPYIYQIPTIQTYINLDRMIVNDIMNQFKTNF